MEERGVKLKEAARNMQKKGENASYIKEMTRSLAGLANMPHNHTWHMIYKAVDTC